MQTSYEDLVLRTSKGSPISDYEIDEALSSKDFYLQWVGAKAAGLSENPKWINKLEKLAVASLGHREPDLNTIAVWAIAKMPKDLATILYKDWADSERMESRRAAADLIGEARLPEGANTLASLLDDREDEVAKWAALSLAKLGEISAKTLERVAQNTDRFTTLVYCLDALVKLLRHELAEVIIDARKPDFDQVTDGLLGELRKQNSEILG